MKKQLIWVFEWRKAVHYWWSYILFSPECKELTSMLDPLLYRWSVPPVFIRCALDHAKGGAADLDLHSEPCHRNDVVYYCCTNNISKHEDNFAHIWWYRNVFLMALSKEIVCIHHVTKGFPGGLLPLESLAKLLMRDHVTSARVPLFASDWHKFPTLFMI